MSGNDRSDMMDVEVETGPSASPPRELSEKEQSNDIPRAADSGSKSPSSPVDIEKSQARARAQINAMREIAGGGRFRFQVDSPPKTKTPSKISSPLFTSAPPSPTANTTPPRNFIELPNKRAVTPPSPKPLTMPQQPLRPTSKASTPDPEEEAMAIDFFESIAKEGKLEDTFGAEVLRMGEIQWTCPWNSQEVTIDLKTYGVIDRICDIIKGKSKDAGPTSDEMIRGLLAYWRREELLPWVPEFENKLSGGRGGDGSDQEAVDDAIVVDDDHEDTDMQSSVTQNDGNAPYLPSASVATVPTASANPAQHAPSPDLEASPLHEVAEDHDEVVITAVTDVPPEYRKYSDWNELNADYRCWSGEEVRGLRKAVCRFGMLEGPKDIQKYMNEHFRPTWTDDFGFEQKPTKVWSIALIHRRSILEGEKAMTLEGVVAEGWQSLIVRTVFDKGLFLLDDNDGALWEMLAHWAREREGAARAKECANGVSLRTWFRRDVMPHIVNARIPPQRGYHPLLCPSPELTDE